MSCLWNVYSCAYTSSQPKVDINNNDLPVNAMSTLQAGTCSESEQHWKIGGRQPIMIKRSTGKTHTSRTSRYQPHTFSEWYVLGLGLIRWHVPPPNTAHIRDISLEACPPANIFTSHSRPNLGTNRHYRPTSCEHLRIDVCTDG